jgi:endonuclease YncB( thermonuclease family)
MKLLTGSYRVGGWAVRFVALALCGALIKGATAAEPISGIPHIVDGDTLEIGGTKIRLQGIDAPETDQLCLDQNSAKWTCGIAARDHLTQHIYGRSIECVPDGADRYHRTLAVCRLGDENLNAWMVREGFALAFVKYSRAHVDEEGEARKAQRVLWSGAFIAPWDWRHRDKGTTILGPLSVPIDAQKLLLQPASATEAPSPDCTIKGNVNRKGERIYHLPGGLDYGKINMGSPTKRWFCSEAEAAASGWRPARR